MGILRINVFQIFNPQDTKINICMYNLYYFLYLNNNIQVVVLGDGRIWT